MEVSVTWRKFKIFDNAEDLARHAAGLFVAEAAAAIERQGKFSVALSGGTTPGPLYSTLATADYRTRINWNEVHFFWTDERCVPPDHPESNFRLAFDLLISKLQIPDSNIHRIQGEMKAEKAAEIYEKDLLHHFHGISPPRFDLIFLGVGSDGHTASIFPDMEVDEIISRAAIPVHVKNVLNPRVSLTLPVLNNANKIFFLVVGKKKSGIVRDILERNNNNYPAGRIRPTEGVSVWLLDHEAACLLAVRDTY
jgi:6-phosphogluconolactonase